MDRFNTNEDRELNEFTGWCEQVADAYVTDDLDVPGFGDWENELLHTLYVARLTPEQAAIAIVAAWETYRQITLSRIFK